MSPKAKIKTKTFTAVRVSERLYNETKAIYTALQETESEYIRKAVEMRNEKVLKNDKKSNSVSQI